MRLDVLLFLIRCHEAGHLGLESLHARLGVRRVSLFQALPPLAALVTLTAFRLHVLLGDVIVPFLDGNPKVKVLLIVVVELIGSCANRFLLLGQLLLLLLLLDGFDNRGRLAYTVVVLHT